ncbi:hypothetical protein PSAC2689_70171 [Paraburkholderia sacchari]
MTQTLRTHHSQGVQFPIQINYILFTIKTITFHPIRPNKTILQGLIPVARDIPANI